MFVTQDHVSAGMPQRLKTGLRRSAHASIQAHSARLASQQFPIEEEPVEEMSENLVNDEQNDDDLGTMCDTALFLIM
jgi:hypothetical protein